MATERIRRMGCVTPVEGDLVQDPHTQRVLVFNNTTSTSSNSTYTIEDVVLPLPGFAVKYPTNEIGTGVLLTRSSVYSPSHCRHQLFTSSCLSLLLVRYP
jgi:tRNA(Glu) U13 pseudouridine synthase TruD